MKRVLILSGFAFSLSVALAVGLTDSNVSKKQAYSVTVPESQELSLQIDVVKFTKVSEIEAGEVFILQVPELGKALSAFPQLTGQPVKVVIARNRPPPNTVVKNQIIKFDAS